MFNPTIDLQFVNKFTYEIFTLFDHEKFMSFCGFRLKKLFFTSAETSVKRA